MVGGIVFVVAMVLVVPVGVMLVGAAWTVLFGQLASDRATAEKPETA